MHDTAIIQPILSAVKMHENKTMHMNLAQTTQPKHSCVHGERKLRSRVTFSVDPGVVNKFLRYKEERGRGTEAQFPTDSEKDTNFTNPQISKLLSLFDTQNHTKW